MPILVIAFVYFSLSLSFSLPRSSLSVRFFCVRPSKTARSIRDAHGALVCECCYCFHFALCATHIFLPLLIFAMFLHFNYNNGTSREILCMQLVQINRDFFRLLFSGLFVGWVGCFFCSVSSERLASTSNKWTRCSWCGSKLKKKSKIVRAKVLRFQLCVVCSGH